MARILLAWELGGNRGHVVKLGAVAARLVAEGHAVGFAVQRPDALRALRATAEASEIRQAPLWPGLLRHGPSMAEAAGSYGDILAGLMGGDSGVLEYLLRAWDRLLADARPDLLIAEFAPAALLAARGHVPTIALGTGFTVPPAHLDAFPTFPGWAAPDYPEATLLRVVNHALARTGRALLARLPELARADRLLPAVFAELDPYAPHRTEPPLPPFLDGPPGRVGKGGAVFAYLPAGRAGGRPVTAALSLLAARGLPVEGYLPGLPGSEAARLASAGIRLHPRPVPPADIAARARLAVTTGGIGFLSSALAAGLPLALLPTDQEKHLNAAAAAALGTARVLGDDGADAPRLAERLEDALDDPRLTGTARALAPALAARLGDPTNIVASVARALLSLRP